MVTTHLNKMTDIAKLDSDEIDAVNALTDRVKKLKEECIDASLYISGQHAFSFTESWKETGNEPLPVRWALAFARVLKESPIVIRDGELIIGSETEYIRGAEVCPEHSAGDILAALERRNMTTMSEVMAATVEPEHEKVIIDACHYWQGKSIRDIVHQTWLRQIGDDYVDVMDKGARIIADTVGVTGKVQAIFNPNRLDEGLKGVIARAKAEKENMKTTVHDSPTLSTVFYHKIAVLDSIIIACEAVIDYAHQHAEAARNLAQQEKDQVRKKELEQIAEICEWIPANPPRNFHEALQFYWFAHLAFKKEAPFPAGACPGLMDRYMYPYYKKDLDEGRLTRQDAAELLGCLWVKFNELQSFHGTLFTKEAAGSLLQQITIGGQDIDGRDATNEFSYLLLEIARQMKMPQPGIYIRWHNGLDYKFMVKAIETNRDTGAGIPAFLNEQAAIRNYLGMGTTYEDALGFSAAGCLSYTLGDVDTPVRMPLYINIPKVLEVTLYNGFDPRSGKQVGPKTGDCTTFTSIEELYDAFWKQYTYFVEKAEKDYYVGFMAKAENLYAPFTTAILEDSVKKGLDGLEEGGRYPQLCVSFGQRGCVDVADALSAIKKLVFDDQTVSMVEMVNALKANWEGYENIRKSCLEAPKYGNDDDYVDNIFNMVSLKCNDIITVRQNPWTGTPWKVTRPALTGHYYLGEAVGALPNGRITGTPLYDAGLSALAGADVNGPTSLVKSATKVNHFKPEMDSLVMNVKLTATVMKNRESIEKMMALLKTFFDRGGWHIQFNILNREDLLEAKKHPEQWKHLIVRVVGYSAFFVELPEAIQDEIIARTEHGL